MADALTDDFLRAGVATQSPPEAPDAPRAPEGAPQLDDMTSDFFDAGVRESVAGRLSATTRLASEQTPQRSAEILRLRRKTGFELELVERNLDDLLKAEKETDVDLAAVIQKSPAFAEWMAKDPHRANIGRNELEELSSFSRILAVPREAATRSIARQKANWYEYQSALRNLNPAEEQDNKDNRAMADAATPLDPQNWAEEFSAGLGDYLPQLFGQLTAGVGAAKTTVPAGIAGGAAIGSLAYGVGAAPGAVIGAGVGVTGAWMAGALEHGIIQEAGGAIYEFKQIGRDIGEPLDEDVAKMAGLAAGLLSGPLDMVELGIILKTFPALRPLTAMGSRAIRNQIKKALLVPTVRAGLKQAAISYATAVAGETAQEGGQRAVVVMARELTKGLTGKGGPRATAGEMASEISEELIGAPTAFGLALLPGPTLHVARVRAQTKQAIAQRKYFDEVAKRASASKTVQESPDAAQDLAASVSTTKEVFVPAQAWETYWQSQGQDPREVYKEIVGDTKSYDHSIGAGIDIPIPTAAFSVRIAPTEHYNGLADDLKLGSGPEFHSKREMDTLLQELKAEAAASESEAKTAALKVLEDQLVAAGTPADSAATYAKSMVESTLVTLAARSGMSVEEVFKWIPQVFRMTTEQASQLMKERGGDTFQQQETLLRFLEGSAVKEQLYHATPAREDFTQVDVDRSDIGFHVGTREQANQRARELGEETSIRVMPVYARMRNPLRLRDTGSFQGGAIATQLLDLGILTTEEFKKIRGLPISGFKEGNNIARKAILRAGYDSIVYLNRVEGLNQTMLSAVPGYGKLSDEEFQATFNNAGRDSYIALDPAQVKSAIGNIGTFDPDNPNLLFQRGADVWNEAQSRIETPGEVYQNQDGSYTFLHPVTLERFTFPEQAQAYAAAIAAKASIPLGNVFFQSTTRRPPLIDRGHRREAATGRYVGGPGWVGGSPAKLGALHRKLLQLAQEGEVWKHWYKTSAQAVLSVVGGDINEAERLIGLIAIYSPHATVMSNTAMALNAYYQWKAGVPIDAGLGLLDVKANDFVYRNTGWDGVKTNSFYQNLMAEIDPSRLDPKVGTMDMWIAIALDYGYTSLHDVRYEFARKEIEAVARRLGWKVSEAQAAIWAAIRTRADLAADKIEQAEIELGIGELVDKSAWKTSKSSRYAWLNGLVWRNRWLYVRDPKMSYEHLVTVHKYAMQQRLKPGDVLAGGRDFSYELRGRIVQMSIEAKPSSKPGHALPGIHLAPLSHQREYMQRIYEVIFKGGRNRVADAVSAPQGSGFLGFSAWESKVGAGWQLFLPVPLEGTDSKRHIKAIADAKMRQLAAAFAYVLEQDMVPYHTPIWTAAQKLGNGYQIRTGRPLTYAETKQLYDAMRAQFNSSEFAPGYRPNGARVLNFEKYSGVSNKAFTDGMDKVMATLPSSFGGGIIELSRFHSEGDAIVTDWEKNPNGEDTLALASEGRSDIQRRLSDIRADVISVNQEFIAKYGWDNERGTDAEQAEAAEAAEEVEVPSNIFFQSSKHLEDQYRRVMDMPIEEYRAKATRNLSPELQKLLAATPPDDPAERKRVSDLLKQELAEQQARERLATEFADRHIVGKPLFQKPTVDDKKGAVWFGEGQRSLIAFLEKSDPSTFIHEMGHVYLEIMRSLAAQSDVPQQIRDDWQLIRDFLGVDPGATTITRAQHEKWADSIMTYVMEGRAPSIGLREAFARMSAWLKWIWKQIDPQIKLTDEVRGVMDRIFATDAQIAAANMEHGASPLFIDAAKAGMDQITFDAYKARLERVALVGRDAMRAKMMRAFTRESTAEWKKAREVVEAQVTAEANEWPVYKALAAMRFGKTPDGQEIPLDKPPRLNRASIIATWGEEVLPQLRGLYTVKGGISVEQGADIWGFDHTDQMRDALLSAVPKEDYVKAVTDQRMKLEHGDPMTDGTANMLAVDALYNDERKEVIKMEMRALAKLVSAGAPERVSAAMKKRMGLDQIKSAMTVPSKAELDNMTRGLIGQMSLRDIHPGAYKAAAMKASKEALLAAGKGEYLAAAQAKMKELLNVSLVQAVEEAQVDADKLVDLMRSLRKTSRREAIGKAGADYLDQLDAISARFEFTDTPYKTLDKRQALLAFIKEREAAGETLGEEIQVPMHLVDEARRVNYRTLSIDELRGMHELVRQLVNLARLKNKLLAKKRKERWEQMREALIGQLYAAHKTRGPQALTEHGMTAGEKVADIRDKFDASILKPERLFQWFDEGQVGPWHDVLFDTASDAQSAEYDLTREVAARVDTIIQGLSKETRQNMSMRVVIPGIPRMVRAEAMGAVLNMGNESNLYKLGKGMEWSDETLQAILDSLTKEEMDAVQGIWDALASLKEPIWALQKELTGLEPEPVVPREVVTRHGTYSGGYYPMFYSGALTAQGQMQVGTTVGNLTETTYVRATTPRGHTISRTAFTAPLDLDVNRLSSHLAGVIKDLTHRRWLVDANKVVNDPKIRAAVVDTFGAPYMTMLDGWVRQVVNDRNYNSAPGIASWSDLMSHVRNSVIVVGLGFKVNVWLTQFAGIPNAIAEAGAGRYAKGLAYFYSRPVSRTKKMRELSGEMRNRSLSYERNIRERLLQLSGREDIPAQVQRVAMYMIPFIENLVSAPAWWGVYNDEMAKGTAPEKAVHMADSVVRLSQGASAGKDAAAVVMNNDLLMRALTMFYTPFSAMHSQLRDAGHKIARGEAVAYQFLRIFWVYPVAAFVASLASGQVPDSEDEPEEWAKWALKTFGAYPFMGIPLVRDIAGATFSEYGYSFTPAAQLGKAVTRLGKEALALPTEEGDWVQFGKAGLDAAKYLFKLPVTQLQITGGYMWDLAAGEEHPESMGELAYYLLYRRPPESKR